MARSSLSTGQLLDLRIDGLGSRGEGVGRAGGRAVFVPFAAPAEKVRLRIVHEGQRRLVGRLVEVLEASADRTQPACEVFGRCGGCQLMHLTYPAQLALKRRLVVDALRTVAGIEWPKPVDVVGADPPLGYRNRGQYPVRMEQGQVRTGFYAERSHRVVPVECCRLHHPDLDAAVGAVRSWAGRKRVPIYDERTHKGWLRHVVGRRSHANGKVVVALVGASDRGGTFGDLVRRLRRRAPSTCGLLLNINPAQTNVVLGPKTRPAWGRAWITERLAGIEFRLSVGTFFQVNTPQAEVLFAKARTFLADVDRPLVDAYCGVGVFGLTLAAQGHTLHGIEMVESAVAEARRVAADHGLRAAFYHGRVEAVLPALVRDGLRPGAVLLDPPRRGCAPEVLSAVADGGCQRVAYLSCHPGTLARDLARLAERGYRLDRLEAVDMFPQTAHVETFAGLVRR